MNYLTYQFTATENEGTPSLQTLNAEVNINREKECGDDEDAYFYIWRNDRDDNAEPFSKESALLLRDFLVFCFPINP
jgi:hypothetical protein